MPPSGADSKRKQNYNFETVKMPASSFSRTTVRHRLSEVIDLILSYPNKKK
jgi:hypothetical protein